MIKIWQRYLFKETAKLFFFFLFTFYLLYVLIDYSAHFQGFMQNRNLSLSKVGVYYCFQFFKRAHILIPLALLLAAVKHLVNLNQYKELVAFQSAGLKKKTLLKPLFFFALLCSLFNVVVMEYIAPHSLNAIDKFYDSHLRHSYKDHGHSSLHTIQLDDRSILLYQYFDLSEEAFYDVIWIRSPSDIWKMRSLKADLENPVGHFIDHLVRKEDGVFVKKDSYPSLLLKELKWQKEIPRKGFIAFENRSISNLYALLKSRWILSTQETNEVITQLLYKLTIPLLPLFVVLAVAPFCLIYSRTLSPFLIFATSLLGLLTFIAMLDSAVILGESGICSPLLAILSPFILVTAIFGWKFKKT